MDLLLPFKGKERSLYIIKQESIFYPHVVWPIYELFTHGLKIDTLPNCCPSHLLVNYLPLRKKKKKNQKYFNISLFSNAVFSLFSHAISSLTGTTHLDATFFYFDPAWTSHIPTLNLLHQSTKQRINQRKKTKRVPRHAGKYTGIKFFFLNLQCDFSFKSQLEEIYLKESSRNAPLQNGSHSLSLSLI